MQANRAGCAHSGGYENGASDREHCERQTYPRRHCGRTTLKIWPASRDLYNLNEDGSVLTQYSSPGSAAPYFELPEAAANPIYLLVHYLLRRLSESMSELKPLARYWTLAEVPGRNKGGVAVRTWDRGVLTPELAARLDAAGWIGGGWF